MITIIAAASTNNALGKDNDLVWHLPNDFKRFKALTTGHFIIMGRKTFESFPKPLPNRTHVIISNQINYSVPNDCILVNSVSKALEICPKDKEIFIIGGGQIYKQALFFADKIELTRVHTVVDADTFFPEIDENIWKLVSSNFNTKDDKHLYDYSYLTYLKK